MTFRSWVRWLGVAAMGLTAVARAQTRPPPDAGANASDGDVDADRDSRPRAADREIPIAAGRTTTLTVEPPPGRPLEREPAFVANVPTYRRAIECDATLRWAEAVGLYQQALSDLGAAAATFPSSQLEQTTLKIEQERRRSRTLAQTTPATPATPERSLTPAARAARQSVDLTSLDRGRLLRLKLMAVRAATGVVPGGLLSATLGTLGRAMTDRRAPGPAAPSSTGAAAVRPPAPAAGQRDNHPELRLLLCATRAAGGDRVAARLELAHVARADRLDPARAVAAAACHAALGHDDQALASLAVAVSQLGPSSRLLPGPSRELHQANDWDRWRGQPRFENLFR